MIDTHCHLCSYQYKDIDTHDIVQRALDAGVHHMISLGTHYGDWAAHLELQKAFPQDISICLGIHPTDAHNALPEHLTELEELAQQYPLAAIGESGLDYYHPAPEGWNEADYHQKQKDLLQAQFKIAAKLGYNLVMHTRDRKGDASFKDAVNIAKMYPNVRTVFHCFIGSQEQARIVLEELNGFISFTGVATFKNAKDVLEIARNSPLDRIMLETDAPYLSPEPYRGQLNEPSRTFNIAECIAKARNISIEELDIATTQNAQSFFKIKR